jgi:hypothetical protein
VSARCRRSSGLAERELRDALLEAAPDDDEARERSWQIVRAAYASREPVPGRRSWKRPAIAAAFAALAAVGVATASAPDSGVGRWVRSAFRGDERPPARPALASLPGGGRLLVASGGSVWAVASDGGKRRLGAYVGGSWSPSGRFAVVWRGRQLTAIEPGGRVRWSRAAPRPIALARWGPVDGFRIAYLAGAELRIVNGDGTGDRDYGPARRAIAPAWRPDDRHVLAYADRRGRVNVAAVDTRRLLWRSAPLGDVVALAWSADGSRLFVATRRSVVTFDRAGGRPHATHAVPPDLAIASLAAAPVGRELALVRHDDSLRASDTGAAPGSGSSPAGAAAPGRSEVVVLEHGRARSLFTAPGRLGAPAWSPDGRTLLVPWPAADQWLFLRARGGGRVAAVADMARQFAPGRTQPPFPGAVEWCCGS